MVAARLANMKQGARTDLRSSANLPEVSQPTAAAMLNVSERLVHSAKAVQESSAAPELQRAVERGEGTVTTAADLSALPVEQQEIVARGEQEILRAAKAIRTRKTHLRHAETIRRIAEISKGTRALPTGQRFPVILSRPAPVFESLRRRKRLGARRGSALSVHANRENLRDAGCGAGGARGRSVLMDDGATPAGSLPCRRGMGLPLRQQHFLDEGPDRTRLLRSKST